MKKEEFLDLIQNKLSNVVVRETTQYTALDVNGKMSLEVHFLSNKIKIQMNSKYLNEMDLLILSKVPASHNWSMDSIYYINNNEDFNKVFPIISKVYDASSANYWMIVAGKDGSFWDTFKSENIVSIDFSSDLTDILEYDAPKSLNQGKNQNKYIFHFYLNNHTILAQYLHLYVSIHHVNLLILLAILFLFLYFVLVLS